MGTAFGKDFQALDATLSALAGLATGANKLPYFTGNDTAAQTDLTSVGRDIIGKNTIADILTYLGLGEAAKRNVGTGANQIPDMSSYASGSGWRKMPDGSIEQWGGISFPGEHEPVSANVSFPIPFTQTPDIIIVFDGGFGGGNMWGATNWSTTGFIAHCNYGLEGGAFYAKGR